jgi:hypothetical protein
MKWCSGCRETKDPSEFYSSNTRCGRCKACVSAYAKECRARKRSGLPPTARRYTGTPTANPVEYITWKSMIGRCYQPTATGFAHYGGRGIAVCDRWRSSFDAFLADVGKRPSEKHSLDRINNNGNYEPGNCRWATLKEQRRNTRANSLLTFRGETRCVTEWAEIFGLNVTTLSCRLRLGWPTEKAFVAPVKKSGGRVMTPRPLSFGEGP